MYLWCIREYDEEEQNMYGEKINEEVHPGCLVDSEQRQPLPKQGAHKRVGGACAISYASQEAGILR